MNIVVKFNKGDIFEVVNDYNLGFNEKWGINKELYKYSSLEVIYIYNTSSDNKFAIYEIRQNNPYKDGLGCFLISQTSIIYLLEKSIIRNNIYDLVLKNKNKNLANTKNKYRKIRL